MFRRIASAAPVRLALCAAALLAVAASFGLHPEPLETGTQPPPLEFAASDSQAPAHTCLACLTHGAALVSPLDAIPLAEALALPALFASGSTLSGRLAGRQLSGRSPPSRS
jgi:hypothetical protein